MTMISLTSLILPFILGIGIGFIAQRSKLCLSIAVTELFLMRKISGFKPFAIFALTNMVGLFLLSTFLSEGAISFELLSKPFGMLGIYALIGGFLFGIGMILAGGCGIGVFYRVGEGKLKSFIAFIGIFSTMVIYAFLLHPFLKPLMIPDDEVILLQNFLKIPYWILVSISLLLIFFWFFKEFKEKGWKNEKKRIAAGFFLGLINLSSIIFVGNFYFIGNAQLYLDPVVKLVYPSFPTIFSLDNLIIFAMMLPLGTVLGSFISASMSGEFKITKEHHQGRLKEGLIGGSLIGLGAGIAMNCNYGHLIGISVFSLAGILGFIGILIGGYLGIKIVEKKVL